MKVVSPFTTLVTKQDAPRAAAVGFANTEEPLHEKILGRKAFQRGAPGRFNRSTNTGGRVAVAADYDGAIRLQHEVVPIVHEVFGGWGRRAVQLFRQLARTHDDRIDRSQTSWACRTFTTYHAQRISTAIHVTSANEILTHLRSERTTSMRGRRRPRERVQPGTRRTAA